MFRQNGLARRAVALIECAFGASAFRCSSTPVLTAPPSTRRVTRPSRSAPRITSEQLVNYRLGDHHINEPFYYIYGRTLKVTESQTSSNDLSKRSIKTVSVVA